MLRRKPIQHRYPVCICPIPILRDTGAASRKERIFMDENLLQQR